MTLRMQLRSHSLRPSPPPQYLASLPSESETDEPDTAYQHPSAASEAEDQDRVPDSWFQNLADTVDLLVAGLADPLAEEMGIDDGSSPLFDPSLGLDILAENPSSDQPAEALNSQSTSGDAGSQPPPLNQSDDDDTSALLVLASHFANRFAGGLSFFANQGFAGTDTGSPLNGSGNGEFLTAPSRQEQAAIADAFGQLPLRFEANVGQVDGQVHFLSRGNGYNLFLTATEAVFALGQSSTELRMQIVGGNPDAQAVGLNRLSGNTNYLIGNDASRWLTDIPNYGQVQLRQVYEGIDLVYYGTGQRALEYDFIVSPGANPNAIALSFQGAERLAIDTQGDLVIHTAAGQLRQHAPITYQEINGTRREVSSSFVLGENQQVTFAIGAHDPRLPLVIDPQFEYASYLGGVNADAGFGIAVRDVGAVRSAYVVGTTNSPSFRPNDPDRPAKMPHLIRVDGTVTGGTDVFVAKLDTLGTALDYLTYLVGSADDQALDVAVDDLGKAYVTGFTNSGDFPVTLNPWQVVPGDGSEAFVAKLNVAGNALTGPPIWEGTAKTWPTASR